MYAPAFAIGFRTLGHDVRCIKTESYRYPQCLHLFNKLSARFHIGYPVHRLNKDVVKTAEEYGPDLVFLYRCCSIRGKTVSLLKEKGCIVYTYNNDDPFSDIPDRFYNRHFKRTIRLADENYVYRKKNIGDYLSLGIKAPRVLLPYFLSTQNFYMDVPNDIPIAFVGHYEGDGRDALLLSLRKAGLPVSLYSSTQSWRRSPYFEEIKDFIQPGAYGADYNKLLNRIEIAIVFLSKINHDTYTRRCFEIPATSTLMLCEYTDDMDALFPEDECACYFRSGTELIDKCRYLLSRPDEVKRIAANGYKRVQEIGGTEVDRCRQVLEDFSND